MNSLPRTALALFPADFAMMSATVSDARVRVEFGPELGKSATRTLFFLGSVLAFAISSFVMQACVFCPSGQAQIFYSIVQLISVLVMDQFLRSELTAQVVFHDYAVLQPNHSFAIGHRVDYPVSVIPNVNREARHGDTIHRTHMVEKSTKEGICSAAAL
jgi:hypothetical protein